MHKISNESYNRHRWYVFIMTHVRLNKTALLFLFLWPYVVCLASYMQDILLFCETKQLSKIGCFNSFISWNKQWLDKLKVGFFRIDNIQSKLYTEIFLMYNSTTYWKCISFIYATTCYINNSFMVSFCNCRFFIDGMSNFHTNTADNRKPSVSSNSEEANGINKETSCSLLNTTNFEFIDADISSGNVLQKTEKKG